MRDYIEDRALSFYRIRRCPSCGQGFMGSMARINCKVCQERIEREARDDVSSIVTEVIPSAVGTILNETSHDRDTSYHGGGGDFGGGGASGSWDDSSSSSSYDSGSSYSGD